MYAEVKAADTEYPPFLSATPFQERRGVSGSGLALREHPGTVGFPDAVKRAFHTAVVKQVNTGVSKTLVAPHGPPSPGFCGFESRRRHHFRNEGEYMARGVYVIALSFRKGV